MPEGPSVKRFQLRCSPFVGQTVTKVEGRTRQMNPDELKSLTLCDTQVHGKNLFLAFGTIQEVAPCSDSASPGPSECRPSVPGTATSGDNTLPLEGNAHHPQCHLLEEPEVDDLPLLTENAARQPRKWLRFHFGLYGSIRANEFARASKANKRGDWRDPTPRLTLHFDRGGFLVFYSCRIFQCSSPTAQPATDILSPEFDREQALEALCKATPVCHTLLDQRHFSGLGNIIKNEVLYLAKIHPLSLGSLLPPSALKSLLDHAIQFSLEWLNSKLQGRGLRPQIYGKDKCPAGHEVMKGTFGPVDGLKRLTWWCCQCQLEVLPEEIHGN
ncbi:PREDICTED: endonuclease 8-like 2 [Gekko japonicus]|uniref:DNA-(apurinic or apyrimidinic site) lyase n=1 Tax=Gekko japonicus TaxID=146911 RepID=A0ABM1JSP5_GEKJA|nr:PREDICTED: endonuclease 8-like 2 [Gekko japonicus]